MGNYPVFSFTFKGIGLNSFEEDVSLIKGILSDEIGKYSHLFTSDKVNQNSLDLYNEFRTTSDPAQIALIVKTISHILYDLTGKKCIIICDEYDVPLENARKKDYYSQMLSFIKVLFEQTFKTNDFLEKGIITGCLKIAKASIFTGFNNFTTHSVLEKSNFNEYFGFTHDEVCSMLEYYKLEKYKNLAFENYNGYNFFGTSVVCPWDVVNFCNDIICNIKRQNYFYWKNSSSNSIVQDLIKSIDNKQTANTILSHLSDLIKQKSIKAKISDDITYTTIAKGINNENLDTIWSVLLSTGYLTIANNTSEPEDNIYELKIPNKEVLDCYNTTISNYFDRTNTVYVNKCQNIVESIKNGNDKLTGRLLSHLLNQYCSLKDFAINAPRENYYQGFFNGLFTASDDFVQNYKSNLESGNGYADITFSYTSDLDDIGVIIEIKIADSNKLSALTRACDEALNQIKEMHYEKIYEDTRISKVKKIGIAFFNKECMVKTL